MSGGKLREVYSPDEKAANEEGECFREEGHAWVGDDKVEICIHCGAEIRLD
ncbi:MAG: hypothetical protein ABEJ99_00735 [Candidatus Nanohaloarchaea archaeon]